ncbi:Variant surface glycoprotein [Trypanosoma congolense IL3000]|uniref:Variant surface glycoprotein n=1 Tax=Trypanosoma congolense (strain IL3000) TaxID=1068625 RepID=F9W7I4_TRYCI|nr:Variant surface glycoprotein [Trypanosoma congolense IL3000]
MMRMRVWMVMMVFFGVAASADEKNHNGEEHKALCKVLRAAVGKWGDGGKHLSGPLQKALAKTIFGEHSGGDTLDSLKRKLPDDYNGVVKELGSRFFVCGKPFLDDMRKKQPRVSGHSAPHDLLCLCTPGDRGWPLNNGEGKKLCGEDKSVWGGGKSGWASSRQGEGQMKETWTQVVAKCLNDGGKGENLKYALEIFIGSLGERKPGEHPYKSLGKGDFSSKYACSGKEQTGICVKYYPEDQKAIPWWNQLQDALNKEEQKEQNEREEAEKRKHEAQKQRQPQKQDHSQYPQGPRTAALRSATPSTEENEQSNTENISDSIATIEDTSRTLIVPSCPWLLSALLLI